LLVLSLTTANKSKPKTLTLVMDSPEAIGRSVELYYLTDDPKQIRVGSPLHVVRIGLMLIVAALLSFAGGVIFYKK
jgi:hypothetical protein